MKDALDRMKNLENLVCDLQEPGTEPDVPEVCQRRINIHIHVSSKKWHNMELEKPPSSRKKQMEEESHVLQEKHANLCVRIIGTYSTEELDVLAFDLDAN